MFAQVTVQDILSTLQAPPPEMQAAPGFAELLQYSEADWSQWLEKLRQLDDRGQTLAALPADFLLLPESGIDRAAVQGMQLPLLPEAGEVEHPAGDNPAMNMLAALLYQPEIEARIPPDEQRLPGRLTWNAGVATTPGGGRERSVPFDPPPEIGGGETTTGARPVNTVATPALGLMAGLAPALLTESAPEPARPMVEMEPELPEPAPAIQPRPQWLQAQTPPQAAPAPLLQPHSPAFAQQMQQQVQYMLKQDLRQMELRLDPPELGSLKIHLKVDNGLTHVQIVTATAEARDLLDAGQLRLREILPTQQGQLQLDIRHQPPGQNQQQMTDRDGSGSGGWARSESAPVADEQALRHWQEPRLPRGLVDTFV